MKKVNFSEIHRCTWQNSYEKDLLGKYLCQAFDKDGNYIKCLIGDSYKEVIELQKHFLEEAN